MTRLTELSRSVEGRVVLVTGAGGGQGRSTAHLFADEGAHVAVTDLGQNEVDTVVAEIVGAGGSAAGWTMDVANAERVQQVTDAVAEQFGGLDYLINNAGISRFAPIDSENYEDEWAISIEVLLTAHTRTIRAALPYLRKSNAARIVNIASTEGWGATKFGSPYTAAKHGVVGLTKSLAVELGREAITVNCICPGPIDTAMVADSPESDAAPATASDASPRTSALALPADADTAPPTTASTFSVTSNCASPADADSAPDASTITSSLLRCAADPELTSMDEDDPI